MIAKGINIDPKVCHGKPVISGTRVMVSTVLGALAGGDSRAEVAANYDLSLTQIRDALEYASALSSFQVSAYEQVG